MSVEGATAYVTHFPCIHCAKILVSAGVKTIKYRNDYRNDELVFEILKDANMEIMKL